MRDLPAWVRGRRRNLTDPLPGWPVSVHDAVRHFANPGPAFETRAINPDPAPLGPLRARAVAFYLPQFHSFAENDAWWGDGFTEWRNVARGLPRFAGHYQPRIPRDLGHYRLGADAAATMAEQSALAHAAGIDTFCFYYYWFDGKRLMDGPLDAFAAADIDQSFCILWANENWTRRWDGRQNDVLIAQNYRTCDEDAFIADTSRYLQHPRYLRVAGRPVFIVYRACELPEARTTLARWREKWTCRLGVEPWLLMAQSYDDRDPRPYGLDGAVEFPPHKVSRGIGDRVHEHVLLDAGFDGQVRDYADMVARSLDEPMPDYPLIKTVSPHWDNDARREGRGVTLHGSTPPRYERWLEGAVQKACARPFAGEPLLFVNAWNEWAEGAYLEPDVHYGHAMLNATRRVLSGAGPVRARRLLLVGHDAHANGAQMLLLEIARRLAHRKDLEITLLLLDGGDLLPRYREVVTTHLLCGHRPEQLRDFLDRNAFPMALCNTVVTGRIAATIRQAGTRVVGLVHEMPAFVRERGLLASLRALAGAADALVFAADAVKDGFKELAPGLVGDLHVCPQGVYRRCASTPTTPTRLRKRLALRDGQQLVLGAGYADRRKGFDLFVETARWVNDAGSAARFVWVGKRDRTMDRWLARHRRDDDANVLHLEPFSESMGDWFAAADCLFISSREDPYPSVALEAMSVGLPVVSVAGCTGLDELQACHGWLASTHSAPAAGVAVQAALSDTDDARRQARIAYVNDAADFDRYVDRLLMLLDPARSIGSLSTTS